MEKTTTSAAASKSPAPKPLAQPLDLMSKTLCRNERLAALLETATDKLHDAIYEMAPGETRDRELYQTWMLLITARENHASIDREFHDVERGFLAFGGRSA
jgi:ATP-dependent protease HslVU (ClpYQ) peptidase subunit